MSKNFFPPLYNGCPRKAVRYLKLRVEGEEEGLACAIEAVADLKGLRSQSAKHLRAKGIALR